MKTTELKTMEILGIFLIVGICNAIAVPNKPERFVHKDAFQVDTLIYYISSQEEKTVEVTTYWYAASPIKNDYLYNAVELHIPEEIEYQGEKYRVTSIGEYAFYNLEKLKKVSMPSSLKEIKQYAFAGSTIEEVHFPEGISQLPEGVCYGCSHLTTVTLPTTLKKIDVQAFTFCTGLTEINLPDGLEEIGNRAFGAYGEFPVYYPLPSKSTSLKKIEIPNSVTKIDDCAFLCCTDLKEIVWAPGCSPTIGNYVFALCLELEELTFQENCEEIGPYAYYGGSFSSVTIPEGVKEIGQRAFAYTPNLKEMTIPASVETIAYGILDKETHYGILGSHQSYKVIDAVYCHAVTPPNTTGLGIKSRFTNSNTWNETSEGYCVERGKKLYVPDESVEAYKALQGWVDDFDEILPLSATTDIGLPNIQKVENGKWYTIDGTEMVSPPTRKGIYIHNQKKVIVK